MPSPDSYTKAAKSGEVIFAAGDAGSDLFIIEDGRVELSVAQPPRTFTLEVGDFFGERALVYDQRDSTAKALTACRLLRIDRATFTAIVKVHPEIALLMLRSLPREGGHAAAGAAAWPPSRGRLRSISSAISGWTLTIAVNVARSIRSSRQAVSALAVASRWSWTRARSPKKSPTSSV